MLLERLFENLALSVQPFASCHVARGWRLKLPVRDWVILHFVLKGEGALRVDSEPDRYPLSRDKLVLMPPSLNHAVECGIDVQQESSVRGDEPGPICRFGAGPDEDETDGLIVACGRIQATYGGGPGLFDHLKEPLVIDFADSGAMRGIFQALIEERSEPGSLAMMKALMQQCLIVMFRSLGTEADGSLPWVSALEDPSLARVLQEILERPERPHSLETLAEVAAMSRSVFAEKFQSRFHRTPMDFLRDTRLRRAAQLLHRPELSVGDVAARVGFSSRSHFSRIFTERFGQSPIAFRAEAH